MNFCNCLAFRMQLIFVTSMPQFQHHDIPNKGTVEIAFFLVMLAKQSLQGIVAEIASPQG